MQRMCLVLAGTPLVHEFEEVEDLLVDVLADDGLLLEVRHPHHLRVQLARVLQQRLVLWREWNVPACACAVVHVR